MNPLPCKSIYSSSLLACKACIIINIDTHYTLTTLSKTNEHAITYEALQSMAVHLSKSKHNTWSTTEHSNTIKYIKQKANSEKLFVSLTAKNCDN